MEDRCNPFALLGVSQTATEAEIVERAQKLSAGTASGEERQRINKALIALIRHKCERARHALLEPPQAEYDLADWDRFCDAFRRKPFTTGKLARNAPEEWAQGMFGVAPLTDIVAAGLFPPLPKRRPTRPTCVPASRPFVPVGVRDLL